MFDNEPLATAIAHFLNAICGEMTPANFGFFVKLIRLTLFFMGLTAIAFTLQAWTIYRLGTQTRKPE